MAGSVAGRGRRVKRALSCGEAWGRFSARFRASTHEFADERLGVAKDLLLRQPIQLGWRWQMVSSDQRASLVEGLSSSFG